MDSALIAAIIGAVATLLAGILGQSGVFDKFFLGAKTTRLKGKWESSWNDLGSDINEVKKESFVITKQKGSKIFGYITMDDEPDKRWEFEGNFSGRFLQLFYFPSKEAEDKLFLDYGCYFFDMQGDGSFVGYSIGFTWDENKTSVSNHKLKRK